MRRPYPSDLTDPEYAVLMAHLPPTGRGRPWKHALRELLDGIFYVVRTGCQWRALPHEYPPWQTVYWWFRRFRRDGTWEQLNAILRQHVRILAGPQSQPSACIGDSQSVKTSGVGGLRGFDGGKKINGRKRHIVVDTLGLVLRAIVHSAAIQERATVPVLLDRMAEQFPRPWERGFRGVMDPVSGFRLEWITIKGKKGFQGVLPRRWVVERTFSWLLHSRRLVRDYERLTATDEALIYATMSRLMLRRLARAELSTATHPPES